MRSRTYIATPPGATIKEQLTDRGMSQKEFAARMDMSEKHISHLINGDVQLTPEMAIRLEMVLGIPARFWSNLEVIYREKIALAQAENEMDSDIAIINKFPYMEMVANGWVPLEKRKEERVRVLRKYFELVNLTLLKDPKVSGIACRREAISEKSNYALLVWAQKAKLEARSIETQKINLQKLEDDIPIIRSMTSEKPEIFCPKLITLMAECGIALIFLPHMEGSFLHGATFYDKDKIVLGITFIGKDADRFWFSLFHEIGHILMGHIHVTDDFEISTEDEIQADSFAEETLIPRYDFDYFIDGTAITIESMRKFANHEGIDVGIVVGRLQKEGYIQYNRFNELKTRYEVSAS